MEAVIVTEAETDDFKVLCCPFPTIFTLQLASTGQLGSAEDLTKLLLFWI